VTDQNDKIVTGGNEMKEVYQRYYNKLLKEENEKEERVVCDIVEGHVVRS
jgi:fructose-1-phosphate kinase PfkB-like protein